MPPLKAENDLGSFPLVRWPAAAIPLGRSTLDESRLGFIYRKSFDNLMYEKARINRRSDYKSFPDKLRWKYVGNEYLADSVKLCNKKTFSSPSPFFLYFLLFSAKGKFLLVSKRIFS